MSDEPNGKSGKVWLYSLGLIVAFPLLYVLSVGPAAVLGMRGFASESAFMNFYTPLISFAQAKNAEDLLQSYIKIWMSATETHWPPPK